MPAAVTFGTLLNFAASVAAFVITSLVAFFLFIGVKRRQKADAPEIAAGALPSAPLISADHEIVVKAMRFWLLGLAMWVLLYAYRTYQEASGDPPSSVAMQMLADMNCMFWALAAIAILKGERALEGLGHAAWLVMGGIIGTELCLFGLGRLVTDTGGAEDVFLRPFSMATAMVAPVFVGYAFKMRYRTNSVFILALGYAFLQPLAYGVTFSMPSGQGVALHNVEAAKARQLYGRLHSEGSGCSELVDRFVFAKGESPSLPMNQGVPMQCTCMTVSDGLAAKNATVVLHPLPSPGPDELEALVNITRELGKQGQVLGAYSVVFQVGFRDLVYSILAIMKLALAAAVIPFFVMRPVGIADLLTSLDLPDVEDDKTWIVHKLTWKVFYYLAFVCAGLLVWLVFSRLGIPLGALLAAFLAALAAFLRIWSKGRSFFW